jgi:small subunit ribosomal protein S2
MAQPSIQDLLEAGVHFGHQTSRWNPKMRKFIFAERNGIYIIDLKKTLRQIELAQELVRSIVSRGERILFVCTKKQLRQVIQSEAERSNSFYVTERWLGGMLTNFATIKKQIRRLRELERGQEEGAFDFYTKKERLMLDRERERLEKYLSGVKDMARLPGALFVVDSKKERIAVQEANKLGIPVLGHRRHQRGPGRAHGADRRQRRRHPLGDRDLGRHGRRGARGAHVDAGRGAPPRRRGRGDFVLHRDGRRSPGRPRRPRRPEAPPAPQAPRDGRPGCRWHGRRGRRRGVARRRRPGWFLGATGAKRSWPRFLQPRPGRGTGLNGPTRIPKRL